jgi:hypothetical protein
LDHPNDTGRTAFIARKQTKKVVTTHDVRTGRPVGLDSSEGDHVRLDRQANKRGLNKAAFARMAVLDRLHEEDSKEGGGK